MDIDKGDVDDKVVDDVESASGHEKRGPPLKDKGVNVPLYSYPRSKRHSRVVSTKQKPYFNALIGKKYSCSINSSLLNYL